MKKYSVISLIYETEVRGPLGQYTRTEATRDIPCEVRSITRQEWTMAGQQGISPSCVAVVFDGNYKEEQAAVLEGERYAIYRTFRQSDETVELYLKKETGE